MTYNVIFFSSPAMYPCTLIIDIYIYILCIHITWSGVIEHGNIGQDLRKKNKDFTMDSTIRTIQDHGDLTVGYRRYIFWVFSLTVGIKSRNGRTNTKQLNFTIWKDPESKIQSDLIAQNKCLIGKQTTNLPGFAVNEPFIPSPFILKTSQLVTFLWNLHLHHLLGTMVPGIIRW